MNITQLLQAADVFLKRAQGAKVYSKVRELPETLQKALSSIGYGKKDIALEAHEKVQLYYGGEEGQRAFAILVNLADDTFETHYGSWGGANVFNRNNPVDLDEKDYQLPLNGAVIKGSTGGHGTFATIILHPDNMAKMLPSSEELTENEKKVLYAFKALKSGPYRSDALVGKGAEVEKMLARGYLKQSKNGAMQITTEGKNALEVSGYRGW